MYKLENSMKLITMLLIYAGVEETSYQAQYNTTQT